MGDVSPKYYACRSPWNALTRWDKFKYRHRRNLGMQPTLIIHQGVYVIKSWQVPVKASDCPLGEWATLWERLDSRE